MHGLVRSLWVGWVGHDERVDELTRLALAAGGGDRVAMTAFVRLTQPDVWRLCANLGDPDSADDLCQETYLRALPALQTFRGDSSARTWLLSVARYTCADAVRSRTRYRRMVERVANRRGTALHEPSCSGRVELDALVESLDRDRREAFVLTQVLGLRYDEAAEVCGCPVGTIRSRVARARDDLVGAMAEHGDIAARGC